MIGDPSGRTDMRQMMTEETIQHNCDCFKKQMSRFIDFSEGKALMEEGYIGGGMLPKLQNCMDAIENGVSRVHILDGRIPHCLLLEIFTNKGIGTAMLNDSEEKFYHGE